MQLPQVQIPNFVGTLGQVEAIQQSRLQALAQRQATEDAARARQVAGEVLPQIGTLQGTELIGALGRLVGADPRYAAFAAPLIQRERDNAEFYGTATPAAARAPAPTASAAPGGIRVGAAIPVPDNLDDADILARTLLGEAANQGEIGMRAVGHTVRNRMQATGRGVRDVVLAPSQFEPWGARRQELLAIPTTDPRYQRARQIAEGILAGNDRDDPTGGATHFLNPDLQRQLGRQQPPWAPEGQGRRIGAHVFYTPGGGIVTGGGAAPAAGAATPVSAPADPNVTPTAGEAPNNRPAPPAIERTREGNIIVPGVNMAMVDRASRAPPGNQRAREVMEQYERALARHLQVLNMQQRPENAALPPTVTLGAGPHGPAGVYQRNRDGSLTRLGDPPPPSTQVNLPGDTVRGRADAATLQEVQRSSNDARQLVSLFDRAERAVRSVPEGAGAQLLPIIGQAARAIGIEIAGTEEAEVLRSITNGLAVLQRAPGSGATTDFEMRLYMQAVPRLGNTRQGNLMLIDMGRRLALRRIQEANIWRQHAGEPDLMERLNALPPVFNEDELRVLQGDATPASNAQPGGGRIQADPPAAPAIPPPPRNIPAGSAYSPSRNMWRSPDGRMFNADGTPVR